MKRTAFSALFVSLCLSASAQAGTSKPKAALFSIGSDSRLTPASKVEDSVFFYQPEELNCDPEGDEETPCVATVDHWDPICFQGDSEAVCSEFNKLFARSSEQLLNDGAEEDVELVSCELAYETIPTLTYNLISGHGGPNVKVESKYIPYCPIFIK